MHFVRLSASISIHWLVYSLLSNQIRDICDSPVNLPSSLAVPRLTVYFDGACPVCSREIAHYRRQPGADACAWIDASCCVSRNDRKPGRDMPPGVATWTAHATPAWSAAHLEDDPAGVTEALRAALKSLLPTPLPGAPPTAWHHTSVHRWRYAVPAHAASGGPEWWWDAQRGLGVCGDAFGNGTVEAAWCSGDEFADTVAAWLEARSAECAVAALKRGTTHVPTPTPLAQGVH